MRGLPFAHDLVGDAALGRAAADHALDAVLHHEIERAGRAALDRLPAFDRQARGTRHQGQFLQRVAAIRNLGRQRVMLAFVRKAFVVECLQDDLDLFLE